MADTLFDGIVWIGYAATCNFVDEDMFSGQRSCRSLLSPSRCGEFRELPFELSVTAVRLYSTRRPVHSKYCEYIKHVYMHGKTFGVRPDILQCGFIRLGDRETFKVRVA